MNRIESAMDAVKAFRMSDYSIEYTDEAKQSHSETGSVLTADEHSKMSEIDFKEHFSSKEQLFQWYFSYLKNMDKMSALSELGDELKSTGGRLVSFGSGPSVLEYFLKLMLGDRIQILCTDYDSFIINHAKILFPEMEFCTFDFYQKDFTAIKDFQADTAVMFGSACSMDNERYVEFLKNLKELDIEKVFTFEAGIYRRDVWLRVFLKSVARALWKGNGAKVHSYHAYKRIASELKRIYKDAGFQFKRLERQASYEYAYLLYP